MIPVCYCEDLQQAQNASCEKCGRGYNQEVSAGRPPRFISRFQAALYCQTVTGLVGPAAGAWVRGAGVGLKPHI